MAERFFKWDAIEDGDGANIFFVFVEPCVDFRARGTEDEGGTGPGRYTIADVDVPVKERIVDKAADGSRGTLRAEFKLSRLDGNSMGL